MRRTPSAITSTEAAIAFDQVSFGYAKIEPVLHEIDLQISPNQIVAFVGGTGAGKSTLLSLVPALLRSELRAVSLDGRDLREITKKSLRAQIAIVLQDTLLFSTTIRENIAYGRPDATEMRFAKRRGAPRPMNSSVRLPNGYDSPVGRTRRPSQRRPAPAHRHRPRIPERRADSSSRRTDFRARSDDRGRHHGNDQGTDAWPNDFDRHASARRRFTTSIKSSSWNTGGSSNKARGPELVARGGAYAKLYAAGNYPSNEQRQ